MLSVAGLRCRAVSLLSKDELAVRAVSVRASELVFVRHLLEASEGVGFLIAERGGDVLLVSPVSREAELDEFISDMEQEVGLVRREVDDLTGALNVAG